MTVRITTHSATEPLVKWIAIFILGGALACMFAQTASGVPPRTLAPAGSPIPTIEDNSIDGPMAWPADVDWEGDWDRAATLWRIVHLHKTNRHAEAVELWKGVELPPHAVAWKEVALGVGETHAHQWAKAQAWFKAASESDPNNPMPHYYAALARIGEASVAANYFDDAGPRTEHLVSVQVNAAATNTPSPVVSPRTALLKTAMDDLRQAIQRMPLRTTQDSLLNVDWVVPTAHSLEMPLAVPTVGDLVESLGPANYEGDAHWRLGSLLLYSRSLMEAEEQFDLAADLGMELKIEYRVLARAYDQAGESLDAARAYVKSMSFGGPYLDSTRGAVEGVLREMVK